MAQSRLEKIGTIYSRVTGLLQSGAIKAEHRPLWVQIYEAFPPKYEPRWDRQPECDSVRKILYQEVEKLSTRILKCQPYIFDRP